MFRNYFLLRIKLNFQPVVPPHPPPHIILKQQCISGRQSPRLYLLHPAPIFMYGWTSEGKLKAKHEWLCVLASIIQKCKAHNKCFTGSPRDATPVRGLHSSEHTERTWAKRRRGGRDQKQKESERLFCISKQMKQRNIESVRSCLFFGRMCFLPGRNSYQ